MRSMRPRPRRRSLPGSIQTLSAVRPREGPRPSALDQKCPFGGANYLDHCSNAAGSRAVICAMVIARVRLISGRGAVTAASHRSGVGQRLRLPRRGGCAHLHRVRDENHIETSGCPFSRAKQTTLESKPECGPGGDPAWPAPGAALLGDSTLVASAHVRTKSF